MTAPEVDWDRVRALALEALDVPAGERVAFVRERAGEDAALEREVLRLVAHADPARSDGPLDRPAWDLVPSEDAGDGGDAGDVADGRGAVAARASTPAGSAGSAGATVGDPASDGPHRVVADPLISAGRRLGPWAIDRPIGAGGMGVVWAAHRADGRFDRRVAIKVVHHAVSDPLARARFERERVLLGTLQHPGIASLLDAGELEDGRPYLVMELVEGLPLDRWGADRTIDDRVRLAAEVARVVHHAHRAMIVHRDLKPANILVRENDTPCLLDFGVAGLVADADGPSDDLTRGGLAPHTPRYAAPEQRAGERPDAASDIHALGVVLWELAAGHAAPDPTPVSRDRARRDAERTTVFPSLRGLPPASGSEGVAETGRAMVLDARVATDLDRIVASATHPDPGRRYPSAEHLAEDLERVRSGRPIAARGDDAWYVLRRSVARYAWPITVLVSIILLLASATTVAVLQKRAAERAEQRTEEQAGIARLQLAEAAIRSLDGPSARAALDSIPIEQRGWVWRMLRHRADARRDDWRAEGRAGVDSIAIARSSVFVGRTNGRVQRHHADGSVVRDSVRAPLPIRSTVVTDDGSRVLLSTGRWRSGFVPRGQVIEMTFAAAAAGDVRDLVPSADEPDAMRTLELETPVQDAVPLDGDDVLVAGSDGVIRRWSPHDGDVTEVVRTTREVRDLAHHPATGRVASVGWDGVLRVWSSDLGAPIARVDLGEPLEGVVFGPDGSWVTVAGFLDGHVRTIRVSDGSLVGDVWLQGTNIRALAADPERELVYVGVRGGAVLIVDVRRSQVLGAHFGCDGAITAVAVDESGDRLLVGTASGETASLPLGDPDTGRRWATSTWVWGMVVDGDRIVAGLGRPGSPIDLRGAEDLLLIDADGRSARQVALHGAPGAVRALAIDRARSVVAISAVGAGVQWIDDTGRVTRLPSADLGVVGLAFTASGRRLVAVSRSGDLEWWSVDEAGPPDADATPVAAEIWASSARAAAASVDPAGDAAGGRAGGEGERESRPRAQLVASIPASEDVLVLDQLGGVHRLAWSADDAPAVAPRRTWSAPGAVAPQAVAVHPTRPIAAILGVDGRVHVRDLQDGSIVVASPPTWTVDGTALAWGPAPGQLMVGDALGLLHVLDLGTLERIAAVRLHDEHILALAWIEASGVLFSGSRDRTVRRWATREAVPQD